jgi:hypothetical protein
MFRLCPEEIPAGSYLQLFTLLVIKGFCRKGAESQFLVFLCVHCAYAVKVFHSSSYSCLRVYLPVSLNSDIYPPKKQAIAVRLAAAFRAVSRTGIGCRIYRNFSKKPMKFVYTLEHCQPLFARTSCLIPLN